MFAKVHPADDVQNGNAASCRALAEYLDKETGEGLRFFSHAEQNVSLENVVDRIDGNKKALGADDAKFFMLSLNPSESEQKFLIGRDVNDPSELIAEERQAIIQNLEKFTRSAMDEYAANFGRDKIKSGSDLMYFARVETQRLYKPTDEAVKEGTAKAGELKPGLQFHVHIIVSRKSLDGKTKLSPQVKSTGNEWELEGRGTVKRGFSHENWKVRVQEAFNKDFHYLPKEGETYQVKTVPEQEKILSSIPDDTLRNLLKDYQFTAANQIIYTMRTQGYEHRVRHGEHTFCKEGKSFKITHAELKKFERPLSDEQLKNIAERFDLAKFENTHGVYNENGLQVKEISFDTYQTNENGQKELKSVSYKVMVDEQTKTVVSFATIRQFAYANDIELMKSELDKEILLEKIKNPDLKDLLTNYHFTAANQIVVAMKERGYEHRVKKGVHTFIHPTKGTVSILHKDLVRFPEKVDDETMRQIAERFNLYKYKQDHPNGGYKENDLVSKVIEFKTYVKVPIEPEEQPKEAEANPSEQPVTVVPPESQSAAAESGPSDPAAAEQPDTVTEEKDGAGEPITPDGDVRQDNPAEGEKTEDDKKKYRKELKEVKYDVIYDAQTHTTVPVSLLRHFAYENNISLMDRYKHSYAVENDDLRECLQNPAFENVQQINKEMRARGYRVEYDKENKQYTYTREDQSFTMDAKDLRAFTNYARNTKENGAFAHDAGQITGMVGSKIGHKVMNEILGDNFRTERMVIGHVRTAVTIVTNPASIKMMLLRKIGSFLNPFKEL